MPQINQSSKIGKSSSPVIQSIVNNHGILRQAPVAVPGVAKDAQYNKMPVSIQKLPK